MTDAAAPGAAGRTRFWKDADGKVVVVQWPQPRYAGGSSVTLQPLAP